MKRGYMDRPWHSKMKEAQMTDKTTAMTVDEAVEWAKDAAVLAQLYREKNYGPAIIKEKEERDIQALATLEALAESEAGLRAENAALKQEVERLTDENTHFRKSIMAQDDERVEWIKTLKARAEKAEAELDAARPLIEAVNEARIYWDNKYTPISMSEVSREFVIERAIEYAALANRSGREGK